MAGQNEVLARNDYAWIFDVHDIVFGDMNCPFKDMIGGAYIELGSRPNKPRQLNAWVSPEEHSCATRPDGGTSGTYLPGLLTPKTPRWRGDKISVDPPTFDYIVVTKPLTAKLLPAQPGAKFQTCKLPRTLMKTHRWPSDHTSVVGGVKDLSGTELTVATWNVADPWYVERFWPDAAFGFDWQPEAERLLAIEEHVKVLLGLAAVLGLQEVPSSLVPALVALGVRLGFQVQWVNAGSVKDVANLELRGTRGCSTDEGGLAASLPLPAVMHDMLFAKYEVLKEPPCSEAIERLSLAETPATADGGGGDHGGGGAPAPAPAEEEPVADSWEDAWDD